MSFILKKATIALMLASVFSVSAHAGDDPFYDEYFDIGKDCERPEYSGIDYYQVGCLKQGVAKAWIKNGVGTLVGAVDAEGRVLIPTKYAYLNNFTEGLFEASLIDGKVGLINKQGETVLPFIFDMIGDPNKDYGFNGHLPVFIGELYAKGFKSGLINKQGEIVVEPKYFHIFDVDDGVLQVGVEDGEGFKYGLISYSDEVIAPLIYDAPLSFREGFSSVYRDDQERGYNYIDTKGQLLLPYWVYSASGFSESRAAVKKDNNYGYIDTSGQMIIPDRYLDAEDFMSGRAIVSVYQSEKIKPIQQDQADDNDYVVYGVIDADNNTIIPFEYQDIKRVSPTLFYVEKAKESQGKRSFDFIDNDGNVVTEADFDDIIYDSLSDDLFTVKKGDKWGFVNNELETVIPFEFDQALAFNDDLAAVVKSDKFGFINNQGKIVIPYIYDMVDIDIREDQTISDPYRFLLGRAIVRKDGLWGVINKQNESVLPFEYDEITITSELNISGLHIKAHKNDVVYLFDMDGNPVEADDTESLD
ncbi:WG repeat-containing protein [Psychrobacter sp. FDAARGOS_221]|uniref:WG repeat-containing protein n=1 Tax=Psychrobacter sp. FDAARGOS_221 TaxID=1975705 RepID=UPI000C9FB957|nr:WG repeat-containing protein [Psychrobacter sp. FDAARGOS_221]PNK60464.1 hypothetical protein A6J60_005960 [Psychrobacter sp. FDAARGOS_221]